MTWQPLHTNRTGMAGPRSSFRRLVLWYTVLPALLLLLAVAATVKWLGPLPPHVVVMTTGDPGSDYAREASRYQQILRRSGVQLRLMPSAGGVENLRRLDDPRSGVSIGFAQGGLTTEAESPQLVSLGTVFFEPFWFFSRVPLGAGLEDLRTKRLSMGREGSGARALSALLLRLNGIDHVGEQLSLSTEQAGDALLRGDIDAATLMGTWDTPVIRRLVAAPAVNVVGFPRASAYVALYPYLNELVLPEGVGDLATNRPPTDVEILAPKASLLVRRDLHPAIQYLLLEAAQEIHSAAGIFQRAGQFPAEERGDVPLSDEALRFHKSGRPFLQRYLPFWLAVFASRLLVLLIPVVAVVYPLLRGAPALYSWHMQRRIYRLYGDLKRIETKLKSTGPTDDLRRELQQLDERVRRLHVPLLYANRAYQLRQHIELVQQQRFASGG
jgi:TRAP-type uncharacterized transport system substrate-binding protein